MRARRFLTPVSRFADALAWPEHRLRTLIFREAENGFGGCFPKIGGRRYVDEALFDERVRELEQKRLEAERSRLGIGSGAGDAG